MTIALPYSRTVLPFTKYITPCQPAALPLFLQISWCWLTSYKHGVRSSKDLGATTARRTGKGILFYASMIVVLLILGSAQCLHEARASFYQLTLLDQYRDTWIDDEVSVLVTFYFLSPQLKGWCLIMSSKITWTASSAIDLSYHMRFSPKFRFAVSSERDNWPGGSFRGCPKYLLFISRYIISNFLPFCPSWRFPFLPVPTNF